MHNSDFWCGCNHLVIFSSDELVADLCKKGTFSSPSPYLDQKIRWLRSHQAQRNRFVALVGQRTSERSQGICGNFVALE